MSSSSFLKKLQDIYQKQDKIAPLIEGLEISQHTLDDYYVKLKTIIKEDSQKKSANYEAISGKKQEIEVEALFDPLPSEETANKAPIDKLLILGGAGVGKSTLMQYITYKWSKGELWKDKFDYVYRVSLKVLLKEGWSNPYIQRREDDDLLKCLVHYHLVAGKSTSDLSLGEIAWKKEKTLLLFDGYDEVLHVAGSSYKNLFDEIFLHQNIIFTSRPNAVDKGMVQKFGRQIENIGFDHDGIRQYLTWYFRGNEQKQKKGSKLEVFLEEKPSIKNICHIPVNIAMMCFIWAEGDSHKALKKVSNMSDLYQQVVDHLSVRYYANQTDLTDRQRSELPSQWKGGNIQLDELRVLQHTAYKGLTGGGIEVLDDQRSETLIIRGMIENGDESGIAVQSSINYLGKKLKRGMPAIERVYKYGLLKPEGFFVTDKEPSETELQEHNFSFIHLSFQEFLTAQYFAEKLMEEGNYEEQTRITNFIAQHRNEPRYLMTLKFMAGIFNTSSEKDEQAKQGILRFWDAIMCNPEGMLEFGIETKVTLLMHLLSQTKSGDERIPNREKAVNFIDSVVLGDLSGWSTQLKESDYTSKNIEDGLIEYFINDDTKWLSKKSFELQEKLNPNVKNNADNSHLSVEEIMDILKSMINKFSEPQQNEMFLKVCEVLKDYNEEKWKRPQKALEFLLIIRKKTKLKIAIQKEKELLDSLLIVLYDQNLGQLSLKVIDELLSDSPDPSLVKIVLKHIKQELENLKIQKNYSRLETITHILHANGLGDTQLIEDTIQCLTLFFKDAEPKVMLAALESVIEFFKRSEFASPELINKVLFALIFFQSSEESICDSVSNSIIKLIRICRSNNPQLIQTAMEHLRLHATFLEGSGQKSALKTVRELVLMNNSNDIQSIQTDLKIFLDILENSYGSNFQRISKIILEMIKGPGKSDTQLIQYSLNTLIQFLQEDKLKSRSDVEQTFLGLIKLSKKDRAELARETLERLAQIFENSHDEQKTITLAIIKRFISISDQNDLPIVKPAVELSIQLLTRKRPDGSSLFSEGLSLISYIKNSELIQYALDALIPILQDPQDSVRNSVSSTLITLINSSSDNKDRLAKDIFNKLTPLLQNSQNGVKTSASGMIIKLIEICGSDGVQLAQNIFDSLAPLLKDMNKWERDDAFKSLINVIETNSNKEDQLAKNIFHVLTSMLEDPDYESRAIGHLINLMKKSSDIQLSRDTFQLLTPLLKNSSLQTRDTAFSNLINVVKVKGNIDNQLARNIFYILTSILQNPDDESEAIIHLVDLMEKSITSDIQLTKDIFDTLNPILLDKQGYVRDSASKAISLAMKTKNESDTQLVRNFITILIQLLEQKNLSLRKAAYDLITQLMKESRKSETEIGREVLNNLTPFLNDSDQIIRTVVSRILIKVFKISGNKDTEVAKKILINLVPLLKSSEYDKRISVLSDIVEFSEMTGFKDSDIFKDALNNLIPFLHDDSSFYQGTPSDIIELARISPKEYDQLARDLYETLSPLLDEESETEKLSNSVSAIVIGVMKLSSKIDTQLIQKIFENLISALKKDEFFNRWFDKSPTLDSIIELIELTHDAHLINDTIQTSIELLNHSDPDFQETAAKLFEMVVLRILSQNPDDLTQYFNHSSKELRNALVSSLFEGMKTYVQNFKLLEQLFQGPKSSLSLQNLKELFKETQIPEKIRQSLEMLQNENSMHLSELKYLLISEINQISTLKGHHIIELAIVAIGKEKISVDDSNHQRLIEIAKEVLNIQANYLNDDGFKWIHDNHEKLISLSSETAKSFDRKVFLKLLEHEKISPLEEDLLIKFVKQGLTTSLKISKTGGEIIFEGKRHKLKGDNIFQALEKIAKTIINQQQDLLALQYKQHKPIFIKSNVQGGMKEAAADHEKVQSIADTRPPLNNDSWVLTILRSLINPQSNIILLEKRNAFGDHFIFRLNDEETFRLYPIDIPQSTSQLEKIFGFYRCGEVYKGIVKGLTEDVGEKLFESKSIQDIDKIEGKILFKQTYFLQELLKKGHEDRNENVEKELENKLNDNRKLLEKKFKDLNLNDPKDEDKRIKIREYYEGFVSTFSAVFTSSQAIAVGKLAIDDGTDYFSILNLIIQFKSLDPFGIGDLLAFGLNRIRSHLETTPIMNEANYVKQIASDAVDLSVLAGLTMLKIISKPENRQRIFDAKKEEQPDNLRNKIKKFVEQKLEELKDKIKKVTKMENLFLEEIENTPAFQLGEDDANKIIKKWIELQKEKVSLPKDPKEKSKILAEAVSVQTQQQPSQQNTKKSKHCNMF